MTTRLDLINKIRTEHCDYFDNVFEPYLLAVMAISENTKVYPKKRLEEMLKEAQSGALGTRTNLPIKE